MSDLSRDYIEANLPLYVNGTLDADEARAVAAALEADEALRSEAAALKQLRAAIKDDAPEWTPGEFGLARLMRDIEQETTAAAPAARPARTWLTGIGVGIAAAVAMMLIVPKVMITPEPVYEQASAEADVPGLIVIFRPEATEDQISSLLQSNGLTIVDGPSAVGLYRLRPVENVERDELASLLVQRADIIEWIEPDE